MLEHPGIELQLLIKEKGLTQKAFASILGKKVSEVNELLKGKRNITIQRDYLLHQTLGTPIKYWILKQIDYDYSLLDIEETPSSPLDKEGVGEIGSHFEHNEESMDSDPSFGASAKDLKGEINESQTQDSSSQTPQNGSTTENSHSEQSKESIDSDPSFGTEGKIQENIKPIDSSTDNSTSEGQEKQQETPTKESNSKDIEDFRNRAKIFRTF